MASQIIQCSFDRLLHLIAHSLITVTPEKSMVPFINWHLLQHMSAATI